MSCKLRTTLIYAAILAVFPGSLAAGEFHVDRKAERRVIFLSDAPLEDFEGVTDDIDGYVLWPGDEPLSVGQVPSNAEFYLEVGLEGLDTGIGLRDRHMRENYLHTENFPLATYAGTVWGVERLADSAFDVTLTGTFVLHGQERERSISIRAVPVPKGFHITGEFIVKLEDHDIDVPTLMFLKVDQNIKVSVDFRLVRVDLKE